ncbi:hypothetical protein ABRY94_11805 [Castellaniella ginsengisoli]|uniref:Uncharacterized protein n=1 Tax=Castellaniella ginsengisoli TaxID=546114 RepID=A0AB39EPT6_9BURK
MKMIRRLYFRILKFILAPVLDDLEEGRQWSMGFVQKNRDMIDVLARRQGLFMGFGGDCLIDENGNACRPGAPKNEHPNMARADYVHYDHSDSAAEVAKLMNISKPGRHAIVIDVGPNMATPRPT